MRLAAYEEAASAYREARAFWRSDPVHQARLIQQEVSSRFEEYFGRGLAVIGFERSPTAGAYLFGRWE